MLSKNTFKYSSWYLFIGLIILEFTLFELYLSRNIAHFYPTSFDQSSYLPVTYRMYENIKQYGLIAGLQHSQQLATGFLFPIQATLLYTLFGASRYVALLPNVFYFILLQFVALLAVKSISSKKYMPLFLLALILSIQTPFLNSGGLMDFRIDFIAFCLYGIILSSAIKSQLFLDKKWSIITVLFATFLILMRCITLVYILGVFGLMTCYFYYQLRKSVTASSQYFQYKQRLICLASITLFISLLGLVYIAINSEALYKYYMVGHFLGNEKQIRASEVGITDSFSLLSFYPYSLFAFHINNLGMSIGSGILFIFFVSFMLAKSQFNFIIFNKQTHSTLWKDGFIFLLLSWLIPLVVLTSDMNKSPVVGSIMATPLIWLVIWFCLYIDSKCEYSRSVTRLLNGFAIFFLAIGIWNQCHELLQHKSKTRLKNVSAITQMYLDIGDYAVAHHWSTIYLSVDQICDYLTSGGLLTLYYETRHIPINVAIEPMGASIFAISKKEAIASMQASNVIIFNLNPYTGKPTYPFNSSINKIKPELLHYADSHYTRLHDYEFMDSTYRVYVKSPS